MTSLPCPTSETLEQLLHGLAPAAEAEALERHVANCPSCSEVLQGLQTKDELIIALQGKPSSILLDDEVSSVVERLRKPAPGSTHSVVAKQRAVDTTDNQISPTEPGTLVSKPTDSQQIGLAMVREYRLLAELGRGGMGNVYKAEHTKLKRTVAIKLLPPDENQAADAIARFEREMQAVGVLDHPNIVRAFDAGEFDGRHYLVMEFVPGRDIAKLVPNGGTLSIPDACEIIRQAAIGLQHAHEAGLVHRDLKPSNLMLATSGTVKILDLGLALVGKSSEPIDELTSSGMIMGTIDYMAPEQADETHDVDIRADIYSLGATLYRLLTGSAPFSSDRFNTLVKKVTALALHQPAPVQRRRPEVPDELAALVHRLLAKDPEQRVATPSEVTKLLEPFAAGADLRSLALAAPSPGLPQPQAVDHTVVGPGISEVETIRGNVRADRAEQPTSRRAWIVAVASVALIAITSVVILKWPQPTPIANPVPPTNPQLPETPPQPEVFSNPTNDGWTYLFDGQSLKGWSSIAREQLPPGWKVENGEIVGPGNKTCLATVDTFDDFELELEWKVAPFGNGGVFYRWREKFDEGEQDYLSAPEYQIIDNQGHPDGRQPILATASVFGLYAPSKDMTHPVGEWNVSQIIARGNHIEHWLNGQRVVDYWMYSGDWNLRVAVDTKFSGDSEFTTVGRLSKGRIALQSFSREIRYRKIRLRPPEELTPGKESETRRPAAVPE